MPSAESDLAQKSPERGDTVSQVAIVTTSIACVPTDLVREYGINIVPNVLIWEGRVFRSGVDLTPTEVYRRLRETKTLPTSSHPSIGEFEEVYLKASRMAEGILSIHLPKEMSGIYDTALAAAKLVTSVPIRVLDCRNVVMAQGFVVLAAARTAVRGAKLAEVLQVAEATIPKVRLLATLGTLEYLWRSGRVPGLAALVGSALQIKPIFTVQDGEVKVVRRVRTRERALEYMLRSVAREAGRDAVHVSIFHADALAEAEDFMERIKSHLHCVEACITEFTPVMGAYAGPGVLGVAWYKD